MSASFVALVFPWLIAVASATPTDGGPLPVSPLPLLSADPPRAKVVAPPAEPEPTFDPESTPPYFADKALKQAAELLQAGHALQALKLIPAKSGSVAVRFLRARALDASGDDASAARAYEELAESYPAMAARCHCLAASSFASVGDATQAARHYQACAEDPVRGRGAHLERARMLVKLGKRTEALAELAPENIPGGLRDNALFMIAQIHEDLKQLPLALEKYRSLFVDEPTSPFAAKAREKARELAKKTNAAPIAQERLIARVDKLMIANQVHQASVALAELDVKPLCSGPTCTYKRCHAAAAATEEPAASAEETAAPAGDSDDVPVDVRPAKAAKPFTVAGAKDDEEVPGSAVAAPSACIVQKIPQSASLVVCKAQLLRGWIARKTKANTKALPMLRAVYERCNDADTRARALFIGAQAAAAVKDPDARDLDELLALQFPDHVYADDALIHGANLAREAGDAKAERDDLRRLIRMYPDSDQRAEALFRLFWSHRADGRPDRGLTYLDVLSKEYESGPHGDGGDAERGRYWWGRTVAVSAAKADRAQGVDVLRSLAQDRPLTYYGLLARSFLGSLDPKMVPVPPVVQAPTGALRLGVLAKDRAFLEAIEFWRMGDSSETHDALVAVDMKGLRKDGARGREGILIVAEFYRRMGDDRSAHTLARRELLKTIREGTDPLGRRASLVCYPLAFRTPVVAHAAQGGVSPNFLQGLMREESALDPRARSPVGACGLTQLMPATARQVARGLGIKKFKLDSLWDPDVNIHIGSTYLGQMLRQFGHPGLAAAAYNAGPINVSRWLGNTKGAFDEFVEQIPFSETRGYVKRVLRSYAAYQYLYEAPKDQAVRVSLKLKAAL